MKSASESDRRYFFLASFLIEGPGVVCVCAVCAVVGGSFEAARREAGSSTCAFEGSLVGQEGAFLNWLTVLDSNKFIYQPLISELSE